MLLRLNFDMERLAKIIDVINTLMDNKFTGYIKINFTHGIIGSVEKFEEILKK